MTYQPPNGGLKAADYAKALRLHLNENTAGCSPAVIAALRTLDRTDVSLYPDYSSATTAAERWFGVEAGWVQLTNGLDEGLHVVAQAAARGRLDAAAIIVEPAFEMYAACADAAGLQAIHVPPEPDFAFPLQQILDAPANVRLINLTDPNNPTGIGIDTSAIETIAAARPQSYVLVDEAYSEFSGRTLIGPLLDRHRNLIVGRTFAKAHGLAALRLGALIAHPNSLAAFRGLLPPFSLNVFAVRALEAALDDRSFVQWSVDQARQSRELIYGFCRDRQVHFWPSEGNFVLVRLGTDASGVVNAMADRGVLIRDRSQSPGCAGCVRITAGVVDHTRTCLATLEDVLASRSH